ncbi:hypothetical protein ABPG75_009411 [Micractinium tetrahymenae]
MDPAWDEAGPEGGKPRATRKKKSRMGRLPSTITLEELSSWFHLPAEEAAKMMRVSLTVLKRVARKQGINRWPYRKVKSLTRAITSSQPTSSAPRNSSALTEPLLGGSPHPTLEQQVAAAAVAAAAVASQETHRAQQTQMHAQQQQLGLPGLLGQSLPPLPLPAPQQWPAMPALQHAAAEPVPSWGGGSSWQAPDAAASLGNRMWGAQAQQQQQQQLPYAEPRAPLHRPQPQQWQPASAEQALPQAWRVIQHLLQQQQQQHHEQQQQQQQQPKWPANALGGALQEGPLPDLAAIRAAAAAVAAASAPRQAASTPPQAATPADSTALTPTSADTRGIEVLLTAIEKEQQVEEPAGGAGAAASAAIGAAVSEEVAAPSPRSTQLTTHLRAEERGAHGSGEGEAQGEEDPPLLSIGSEGGSAGSSTDPTIASSQPSASGATPTSSTLAALLGGAAGAPGLHRLAAGSTAQLSALLRGERGGGSAFQPPPPPFDRAASPPAGAAAQADRPGSPAAGEQQRRQQQQQQQQQQAPAAAEGQEAQALQKADSTESMDRLPTLEFPPAAIAAATGASGRTSPPAFARDFSFGQPGGPAFAAEAPRDGSASRGASPAPLQVAAAVGAKRPAQAAAPGGSPTKRAHSEAAAAAVAAAPVAAPSSGNAAGPPAQQLDLPAVMGLLRQAAGLQPRQSAQQAQQHAAADPRLLVQLLMAAAAGGGGSSSSAAAARAPPAPAAQPASSWQQILGLARAAGAAALDAHPQQQQQHPGAGLSHPSSPRYASAQLAVLQLQLEAEKRAREEALRLAQQRAQQQGAAALAGGAQQVQQAAAGANPAVPEQIALLCLQKYAKKLGYNIDNLQLQQ